jgi:DNA-binding HxlR family transcriptional regulator
MDDHQGHIELQGQLVDRDSWSAAACSMDRAVKVIGKRSNLLLLREAFYGSTRFDEFVRRTGLSEPVVASELRHLVDAGLFVRVPYQELGERERLEYRLTEMGRELITSVVALMEWGDRWLAPDGPPIELSHDGCGAVVTVGLRCASGHPVPLAEVAARPGSGARPVKDGRAVDRG